MHRIAVRRLVLPLLAAVAVAVVAPPAASADHQEGPVSLSVSKEGQGTVSGTGISCGDDCSEGFTLGETCVFVGAGGGGNHSQGRVQCSTVYPNVNLSASGTNGFVLDGWSGGGCSGAASCRPSINGNPTTVTAHFRDDEDPVLNFGGPAAESEIGGAAYVFSSNPTDNDQIASVEYKVDGQSFGTSMAPPYQAALDTRPLSHGSTVYITAVATDRTGRTAAETRQYVVDNTVSARFSAVPDPFTNAATPQVEFTSDDGDISGYACTTLRNAVVIAGPAACTSPHSPPATQEGTYEVRVQAIDNQGNTTDLSDTYVIDRTNPAVTVTTPAEGAVLGGGFTPAFTVADANPNPGQNRCSLDGGEFAACAAVPTPSPDGQHTLTVRAVDRAGNVGEDTNSFAIDTAGPQLGITGGPAQNEIITANAASFSFSATDPHAPIGFTCKRDGGAFGGCSGSGSHNLGNLSEGPHTFVVRARDAVGNSSSVERQFTVNAVRPRVQIVGGVPDGAVIASGTTVFRFAAAGGQVACSLDSNSAFRPCSSGSSDTLTGLRDGRHTFRVRVRDEANDQVVAARTFRVDRTRPETAIDAGPADGSLTNADAVTFSFSSVPGSTFRCRFGRLGAPAAFAPCSGPGNTHAATGLAPARYRFEVFAVNPLGLQDLTPARRTFRLTRSFEIRIANTWQIRGAKTGVLDLTVKQVPAGGRVEVSCKGKGCAFKKKAARVKKRMARLTKLFKERRLAPGARIEIRVSAPGAIARVVRFKTRKGKIPTRKDRCLLPGASTPTAC